MAAARSVPDRPDGRPSGRPAGQPAKRPVCLRIAGIPISLESEDAGLEVRVEGSALKFLVEDEEPEVRVSASWGSPREEEEGDRVFDSGGLWRLNLHQGSYQFLFSSPALGPRPYKAARFSPDFRSGRVLLRRHRFTTGRAVYPLEYPLDELLVLSLLAAGRGVEVHAAGVIDRRGRGLLFAGSSGAGKTTLARLWERTEGALVLSDDRVILREWGGRLWIHGTPWHGEAELSSPEGAPLERICFLRHAAENRLIPLPAAAAAARLFAASFPPFLDPRGLRFTLDFMAGAVQSVPSSELGFVPDGRVIDLLQAEGGRGP